MAKKYDVVIIGAGPAGLTAGIYCCRAGLETLILEKITVGGQLLMYGDLIENYPGFENGISGLELIEKMRRQAERFGVKFKSGEVIKIGARSQGPGTRGENKIFQVSTAGGEEYFGKAVIIATGATPKKLGIKGETEFTGKGVSYCAVCDGPLFKDKEVVVVGGGDTAVGEAIYLTRFVKKLTLIHRRGTLRAAKILQERLSDNKKVGIRWDCTVMQILGNNRVTGIKIKNVKTGKEDEISASGVFIFVGIEPGANFLKDDIELDDRGFIITKDNMETSRHGVFACGDVRKNLLKQVITSCAEGAQAAYSCCHYIEAGMETRSP